MISGISLDFKDHTAIRDFLRMAGIVGPWSAFNGEAILSFVERDGVTWCFRGRRELLESTSAGVVGDCVPLPATIVMGRVFGFKRPALMPVYEGSCRDLPLSAFRNSERLLLVRETGQTLARCGVHEGQPYLVYGMLLSEFLRRGRVEHEFFGFGHIVTCLRWWLDHILDRPIIRMHPWRTGRPPCLVSFDVEGSVARRSVGKPVVRFPLSGRSLFEVNRLDFIRPLRGPRLTCSSNELIDPDGCFRSNRISIDLRRGRRGCATKPLRVAQWQLHFLLPRRPQPQESVDIGFHAWVDKCLRQATLYYCGGIADGMRNREEIGFHGQTHEHFHQMAAATIERELAEGRRQIGPNHLYHAVRAPGLLWSPTYFAGIERAGFHIDSSFREVSAFQPIFPIRTAAGWWEFPVTGNILTLPDLDGVLQSASRSGGMVNLHCHDHEVKNQEARQLIEKRIGHIEATGFRPLGHLAFVEWLERSRENQILSIYTKDNDSVVIEVQAVEGTALRVPSGYLCTSSSITQERSFGELGRDVIFDGRTTRITLKRTLGTVDVREN